MSRADTFGRHGWTKMSTNCVIFLKISIKLKQNISMCWDPYLDQKVNDSIFLYCAVFDL